MPLELKRKFLSIWANNGDAISQQYAGTSALKGDYTRTGERNWTGIMKDGVTSANRYYLRFKDNYRQLAFDVLQGLKFSDADEFLYQVNSSSSGVASKPATNQSTESRLNANRSNQPQQQQQAEGSNSNPDEQFQSEREENVRQLVADCRKELVDSNEDCYGSWALINCNE